MDEVDKRASTSSKHSMLSNIGTEAAEARTDGAVTELARVQQIYSLISSSDTVEEFMRSTHYEYYYDYTTAYYYYWYDDWYGYWYVCESDSYTWGYCDYSDGYYSEWYYSDDGT